MTARWAVNPVKPRVQNDCQVISITSVGVIHMERNRLVHNVVVTDCLFDLRKQVDL